MYVQSFYLYISMEVVMKCSVCGEPLELKNFAFAEGKCLSCLAEVVSKIDRGI